MVNDKMRVVENIKEWVEAQESVSKEDILSLLNGIMVGLKMGEALKNRDISKRYKGKIWIDVDSDKEYPTICIRYSDTIQIKEGDYITVFLPSPLTDVKVQEIVSPSAWGTEIYISQGCLDVPVEFQIVTNSLSDESDVCTKGGEVSVMVKKKKEEHILRVCKLMVRDFGVAAQISGTLFNLLNDVMSVLDRRAARVALSQLQDCIRDAERHTQEMIEIVNKENQE